MTIRAKMMLLVTGVLVVSAIAGYLLYTTAVAEGEIEEALDAAVETRELAAEAETEMLRYIWCITQVTFEIKDGDAEQANEELEQAEEHDAATGEILEELSKSATGQKAALAKVVEQWELVDTLAEQAVRAEAAEAGVEVVAGEKDMAASTEDPEELEEQLEQAVRGVDEAFNAVEDALGEEVEDVWAAEDAARSRLYTTAAGALVAIVLYAGIVGFSMVGSISGRLKRAQDYAGAVASGDMDAAYGEHGSDELGSMTRSVEQMKDALVRRVEIMREMAGAVIVTADEVRSLAERIGQAVDGTASVDEETRIAASREAKESSERLAASAETLSTLSKQMLDA